MANGRPAKSYKEETNQQIFVKSNGLILALTPSLSLSVSSHPVVPWTYKTLSVNKLLAGRQAVCFLC